MTKDQERRQRENADLMKRMREGDPLCHTDYQAFRWAPRPIIKKDQAAMRRAMGEDNGQ